MGLTLRTLPLPLRALFSCFVGLIGIGYLVALLYLFVVAIEPHTSKGQGLIEGISEKYHGAPTRVEMALKGSMSGQLGADDKIRIMDWIRQGATQDGYAATIKPIVDAHCVRCHSAGSGVAAPNGEALSSFETFEGIQETVQIDTGPSIADLARLSHVHLFGISIIFFVTGFIFSMSETPIWMRVGLIVAPYVSILADIGSWWLTKWQAAFGVVVIGGGALMGSTLGCLILISLWEMWLAKPHAQPMPTLRPQTA